MSAKHTRAIEALRQLLRSHARFSGGVWDEARAALAAVDARAEAEALGVRLPDGDDPDDYAITIGLAAVDAKPAEPVQEPVAWRFKVKVWIGGDIFETQWRATTHNDGRAGLEPLYTTPPAPKRQPLTDEQITAIVREAAKGSAIRRDGSTSHRIARAIERAHGIGGEA